MSFFSEAQYKFEAVGEGSEIEAENFLLSVSEILPFIDLMGPITFKLPKIDLNSHIQRVLKRHRSNTERFRTLQSIVDADIEDGHSRDRKSCTKSILNLKCTIEFVYSFMECFLSGEDNMVTCGTVAYEKSFKRYQNWAIKKIFHVLIKLIPSKDEFATYLKKDPELSEQELIEHIKETMVRAKTNIDELNRFYTIRGLHFDQKSSSKTKSVDPEEEPDIPS